MLIALIVGMREQLTKMSRREVNDYLLLAINKIDLLKKIGLIEGVEIEQVIPDYKDLRLEYQSFTEKGN